MAKRQLTKAAFRKCLDAIYLANPDLVKKLKLTGRESQEQIHKAATLAQKKLDDANESLIIQARKTAEHMDGLSKADPAKVHQYFNWLMDPASHATEGAGRIPLSSVYKVFRNDMERIRGAAIVKIEKALGGKIDFNSRNFNDEYLKSIYDKAYESPDMAARELAKSQHKINDYIHAEYTSRGGIMGYLDEFAIPVRHNAKKMIDMGADNWVGMMKKELDVERVMDQLNISTPEEFDEMLKISYNGMTTGWSKLPQTGTVARKVYSKLGNRHKESRIFHFKDAESRMRYESAVGDGTDYYSYSTVYSDMMAREMAGLEVFGPGADGLVNRLAGEATKISRARGAHDPYLIKADETYKEFMGYHDRPLDHKPFLKNFQRLRNIQAFAKLGEAVVTSIADSGFVFAARKLRHQAGMKTVIRGIKQFVGEGDRRTLTRMGMGAEFRRSIELRNYRFNPEANSGWTGRAADWTLRTTGLIRETEAVRSAYKFDYTVDLGDIVKGKKSLSEVPIGMRRPMQQYGWTDADVARFSSAKRTEVDGIEFIDVDELSMAERMKYIGLVESETMFAIPDVSSTVRAATRFGMGRDTLGGQLALTAMQLKSFPAAVITILLRARGLPAGEKLSYLATLATTTTMLGAISYQTSQFLRGREMLDWDDPMLWVHAAVKGGAFSLPADMLQASGYTQGLGNLVLGPTASDGIKLLMLGRDLIEGEKDRRSTAGKLISFGGGFVPYAQALGVSIAFERAFVNQVEMAIDPRARSRYRRNERSLQSRTGQKTTWKQGEILPQIFH